MENTSFPAILKMVLISKTTKSNKIKPQNANQEMGQGAERIGSQELQTADKYF